MDQIFDRLGNLLRSVLQDGNKSYSDNEDFSDPDMQAAWDELNDFMNEEEPTSRTSTARPHPETPTLPKEVRDAFGVIGVSSSATNEQIGKAYKALLLKHHPDRFATDPERQAAATERTKQINHAFQVIKAYRTAHR